MENRVFDFLGRRVVIHLGDITEVQAGALVNSENSDLVMDDPQGISVSAAIRRKGGEGMADELARRGPLVPGQALVTAGGRLRAPFVIHAAVVWSEGGVRVTDGRTIRAATLSSLALADRLGLKSVALPAFGVGTAAFPDRHAAQAMIDAVVESLAGAASVEEVIFALIQPEAFIAFFEHTLEQSLRQATGLELTVLRQGESVAFHFADRGSLGHRCSSTLGEDQVADGQGRMGDAIRLGTSGAPRAVGERALASLREAGGMLYGMLLPIEVRRRLAEGEGMPLFLRMDEGLTHVPWELLHDGETFLCCRYAMGRQVLTSRAPVGGSLPAGPASRPLVLPGKRGRALLICDPLANLPSAEGEALGLMECLGGWALELIGGERACPRRVLTRLNRFDLVHFIGHSELVDDGVGWLLASPGGPGATRLGAEQIGAVSSLPAFVFSNSCKAALAPQGQRDQQASRLASSVAGAFILGGSRGVVGPAFDLEDPAGGAFAPAFYERLVEGLTVGQALRQARLRFSRPGGALGWAAYVLYGDPSVPLVGSA